jgi:hypothetical protein
VSHPTQFVRIPRHVFTGIGTGQAAQVAEVDQGILPILTYLWANGVVTVFSCQGDEQRPGYIDVPRKDRLSQQRLFLLALAAKTDPYRWDTERHDCYSGTVPVTRYRIPVTDIAAMTKEVTRGQS